MDKKLLEQYITNGISSYKIAELEGKSQTSIRYWLKKYNLETEYAVRRKNPSLQKTMADLPNSKTCSKCEITKPSSEFYVIEKRGSPSLYSYCKECAKVKFKTYDGRAELKRKCVEYKGGKCEHCKYDRCMAAFDFHHKDSSKKDFSISDYAHHRRADWKTLTIELDKCALLCATCHREVHAGLIKLE